LLRPLAWSRIALGSLLLVRTTPLIAVFEPGLSRGSAPLFGWPHGDAWSGAIYGLSLSANAVRALCVLRTLGALGFVLGFHPRACGLLAALCGYAVLFQDAFGFTFTFHLLYAGIAVLAVGDAGAVLALRPERPRAPRSSARLVWILVASIYFWAGFEKLRRDWLDGRALSMFHDEGRLAGPVADLLAGSRARTAFTGPLVILTELSLGPLLLFPRTRPYALVAAFGFHATIESMTRPDVLGWGMAALLLSFVTLREGGGGSRADQGAQ
jgi:hypothetical protein